MSSFRLTSWLPIGGMMGVMAGALIWLLILFGEDRKGLVSLPDAAGSTVEFVLDTGSELTLSDILKLPKSAWQPWDGKGSMVGYETTVLWMRVILKNPENHAISSVLTDDDFFTDEVQAWVSTAVGGLSTSATAGKASWTYWATGEKVATAGRPLWGRTAAFPISIPARSEAVAYLRATDQFAPWTRLRWWPQENEFRAAQARQFVADGVYFGLLLGLFGYTTMLWLRLRLADIGYYVLYLGATAVFMFLARGAPAALGWSLASPGLELCITAAMALSGIFLTQFARVFLDLKTRFPRGEWLARGLTWLMAGAVLLSVGMWLRRPTFDLLQPVVIAVGLTHATLLMLAILTLRTGARQARFFLMAFGCAFAGSLPLIALWLMKINTVKNLGLTGLMIGSALEMLLLSLAVADRFAEAQRERVAVQEKLMEETEQRRVIQEAYADELAVEVNERTRDLEAVNTDKDRMLIALGHDLRSPLAALTQRAEQLRGGSRSPVDSAAETLQGFSGDVAGAGRQMLLLIEDIVLWARLRTGAQPASSAHPVATLVMPVATLHRPLAERRGVTLTVDVPDALVAWTDLVLAQTMVRNLVGNAVKFAHSRVEVSVHADASAVRITVRDDGPGLPPAVLARLRGEESAADEAEGGGMGLRLSQEIGVTLRARIEARLLAGGGTEMSVIFPAPNAEQTTTEAHA